MDVLPYDYHGQSILMRFLLYSIVYICQVSGSYDIQELLPINKVKRIVVIQGTSGVYINGLCDFQYKKSTILGHCKKKDLSRYKTMKV